MHLDLKASAAPLPPWKQELLLRRSALARTVEPKLNEILKNDVNQVGHCVYVLGPVPRTSTNR